MPRLGIVGKNEMNTAAYRMPCVGRTEHRVKDGSPVLHRSESLFFQFLADEQQLTSARFQDLAIPYAAF